MFDFMKNLFRSNQRGTAGRPLSARLGVEVLEGRFLPSTLPVFTLLAPTSAGATISVEVVQHGGSGGINNNLVSADATTTANLSFEDSDDASVSLGTVTLIDGIGSASVKLPTYPATGELVAIDGLITGGKALTITTGPLTHYVVSAPSQATAGAFQITVTAEDAFGNTLTSDESFPTLTASSGAVSGFNWFEGVGTATVTQFTAGTMTVSAKTGSVTGSATISVIPATATHFVFTNWGSSVASGTFNPATITAEDAFGNPVTNFNQNPVFTASYGFPVSVTTYGWQNGRENFEFSLTAPGLTRLTATVGSVTGTSNAGDVLQDDGVLGEGSVWAGYAAAVLSNVTGVGATWVQPAITGPDHARAVIWVGMDGFVNGTVEQCGTKADINANAQVGHLGIGRPSHYNPDEGGQQHSGLGCGRGNPGCARCAGQAPR